MYLKLVKYVLVLKLVFASDHENKPSQNNEDYENDLDDSLGCSFCYLNKTNIPHSSINSTFSDFNEKVTTPAKYSDTSSYQISKSKSEELDSEVSVEEYGHDIKESSSTEDIESNTNVCDVNQSVDSDNVYYLNSDEKTREQNSTLCNLF